MRYIVVILVMLMFVNVLGCKNPEAVPPDDAIEVENEAAETEKGMWLTDYDKALA